MEIGKETKTYTTFPMESPMPEKMPEMEPVVEIEREKVPA